MKAIEERMFRAMALSAGDWASYFNRDSNTTCYPYFIPAGIKAGMRAGLSRSEARKLAEKIVADTGEFSGVYNLNDARVQVKYGRSYFQSILQGLPTEL